MAANSSTSFDWSVTPEKVDEVIRRIIEVSNPLQIILSALALAETTVQIAMSIGGHTRCHRR